MIALQKWMDVTANNLANVSTTGYKKDELSFADAYDQQLSANGGLGASVGSLSTGTAVNGQYTNFEEGDMKTTNGSLDFALQDAKTMFKVQLADGSYAYTRDGAFQLNAARQLVNTDGYQVMDSTDRPITLPDGDVSVNGTGAISVAGQAVATLGVSQGDFVKIGSNLYESTDATPAANASIREGALEGSNVNAVSSMIDLIKISRLYDLAQRSITQQDQLSQNLISSLQQGA